MANNFICGWCGVSTSRDLPSAESHPNRPGVKLPTRGVKFTSTAPHPLGDTPTQWYGLWCSACNRYSLLALQVGTGGHEGTEVLPDVIVPAQARSKVSLRFVPTEIAADYEEAIRCLQVRAYKGTAVLARRAVEATCDHLLKGLSVNDHPKFLRPKIDRLRDEGELTRRLASVAHKVRIFGIDGSHPSDDELDEVTPAEAEGALTFLEQLLQHVFIIGEGDEASDQHE